MTPAARAAVAVVAAAVGEMAGGAGVGGADAAVTRTRHACPRASSTPMLHLR